MPRACARAAPHREHPAGRVRDAGRRGAHDPRPRRRGRAGQHGGPPVRAHRARRGHRQGARPPTSSPSTGPPSSATTWWRRWPPCSSRSRPPCCWRRAIASHRGRTRELGLVAFGALAMLCYLPATYLAGRSPFYDWGDGAVLGVRGGGVAGAGVRHRAHRPAASPRSAPGRAGARLRPPRGRHAARGPAPAEHGLRLLAHRRRTVRGHGQPRLRPVRGRGLPADRVARPPDPRSAARRDRGHRRAGAGPGDRRLADLGLRRRRACWPSSRPSA